MRGGLNALSQHVFLKTVAAIEIEKVSIIKNYLAPEVRRGKYWGLGVFLLQYFPLVNIWKCCIMIALT